MDKKIISTGVFLLFLLTGCAASDDPRQGGLMGYWYGTSSGKYEERQQEKLKQIEEQKRTTQQLTEQSEQLNTELAIQDRKLAQEHKQALKLEKQLANLNSKINKLKVTSEKQRQQVSLLKADIQNTKQSLENQKAAIAQLDAKGGSVSDPDQTRVLELERDRLADEYRKLNVYYQSLSNATQ